MKLRKWFWGLFFVCAAAFIVLNQLGAFVQISFWTLACTLFLVPIFVESLVHLQFFGVFFPLGIAAILYAEPLGLAGLSFWAILLAALFASIGFSIVFHRKGKWGEHCTTHFEHHHDHGHDPHEKVDHTDENDIECTVSFGSTVKYLHANALRRINAHCSFGALKLFFDNAQLDPNGAEVVLDCSFAGVELYIPRSWTVQNRISAMLGGVDEKNRRDPNAGGPVLTLTGHISLGGVEIVYI